MEDERKSVNFPIVDIFESIQGEGYWVGTPSLFIRLAGCNLECTFCDTKFDVYEEWSLERILERAKKTLTTHVVITGGEPTIQPNLHLLVRALRARGKYVAIETNGTQEGWFEANWLTVSPKSMVTREDVASELKVLWISPQFVEKWSKRKSPRVQHRYVQPVEIGGKFMEVPAILEWLRKNPDWRLSVQIHKVLGIK
jgi:organic radical activating enzyme